MTNKQLILSTLFIMGLSITGVKAQDLYVKQKSGTQTTFDLNNVQKITFSSGIATIHKTDNTTEQFALNVLSYLSFSNYTTGISEPEDLQSQNLTVYPNPASDVININLPEIGNIKGLVTITSIEGKLVKTMPITTGGIISMDISDLQQGIYLCRFANDKENKTVKIIKK